MAGVEEKKEGGVLKGNELAPLKNYLSAQRLYLEGNEEESLKNLSQAVGSPKPLERLSGNLPQVFDSEAPLSDMLLKLTLVESRRRSNP
jgi:hypothetical protein